MLYANAFCDHHNALFLGRWFYSQPLYFRAEGINSINYYNFVKKKKGNIKIKGEINEITFDPNGNILVATSKDEMHYLTIFSSKGEKKYYKEFGESISNFKFVDDKTFYFKLAGKILKIVYGTPI